MVKSSSSENQGIHSVQDSLGYRVMSISGARIPHSELLRDNHENRLKLHNQGLSDLELSLRLNPQPSLSSLATWRIRNGLQARKSSQLNVRLRLLSDGEEQSILLGFFRIGQTVDELSQEHRRDEEFIRDVIIEGAKKHPDLVEKYQKPRQLTTR